MRYEELKFVAAGCALVDDLEVFHERPGGVFTHTPFTANGADAPVKVPKTLVAILADILVAKQIAHDPRFVLATRGATLGTGAFVPGEVGLEIFQLFLFPALFACRPSSVPSGRIIGAHPDLFALDGFRVPTAPRRHFFQMATGALVLLALVRPMRVDTIMPPTATANIAVAGVELTTVDRPRTEMVHHGKLPLRVAIADTDLNGREAGTHWCLAPAMEQVRRVVLQSTRRIESPPRVVHHPTTLGGLPVPELHSGPVAGCEGVSQRCPNDSGDTQHRGKPPGLTALPLL